MMNTLAPNRIAVVSLQAENVPETVHFYRDVLGLRLDPQHGSARPHFDVGGVILTVIPGKPQPPGPERFPVLAFAVSDLQSAVKKLEAHQVPLPWGVKGDGPSRWVMFHDPAGNLVELVEFEA
jgi:catechol 2,3-dioxygenase-like lactoylglutathione lyase family enzyme